DEKDSARHDRQNGPSARARTRHRSTLRSEIDLPKGSTGAASRSEVFPEDPDACRIDDTDEAGPQQVGPHLVCGGVQPPAHPVRDPGHHEPSHADAEDVAHEQGYGE